MQRLRRGERVGRRIGVRQNKRDARGCPGDRAKSCRSYAPEWRTEMATDGRHVCRRRKQPAAASCPARGSESCEGNGPVWQRARMATCGFHVKRGDRGRNRHVNNARRRTSGSLASVFAPHVNSSSTSSTSATRTAACRGGDAPRPPSTLAPRVSSSRTTSSRRLAIAAVSGVSPCSALAAVARRWDAGADGQHSENERRLQYIIGALEGRTRALTYAAVWVLRIRAEVQQRGHHFEAAAAGGKRQRR
jgi:hypothetical protein